MERPRHDNHNDDDDHANDIELFSSSLAMAARADEQPLLVGDGRPGDDDVDVVDGDVDGDVGPSDEAAKDEDDRPLGLFVWLLTLSAGLSGLLFGYDTGVISATLVSIGSSLSHRSLTALDMSIITSCTALLALVASPLASVLADVSGRRRVILAADVLFVVGAVLQAVCHTVPVMVLGRSIVGAAVGAASFVVPLYIAEAAPAAHRGRLVTVNVLFITLGQVVAYVLGWLLDAHADPRVAWRWMVGLGAVPAAVQAVLLVAMPESPRWLVKSGRIDTARVVIARIQGPASPSSSSSSSSSSSIDHILRTIQEEVRAEVEAQRLRRQRSLVESGGSHHHGLTRFLPAWLDGDAFAALFSERRNRRALFIACLLQGLQQLCGFNSLMYFSATIFTLVGFDQPTLTSLTVATTNFVFTVAALLLVDRIGRRRVLLYSIPVMALGLVLAAYGFSFLDLSGVLDGTPREDDQQENPAGAMLVLVSIMLYVASYAIGLGNVPWMQSELFALDVRSLGSGLATATNWTANFVVGLTFLPLMQTLTPTWTFLLYTLVSMVGWVLVHGYYPETSGLSLEDAARLLEDDHWGLRR